MKKYSIYKMPYRRSYRPRARRTRRPAYGGRRRFTTRVRRAVRNIAERKRITLSTNSSGPLECDWTGRRFYLSEIAQGAGEEERIGRMVTPHSFVARFVLENLETASTNKCAWTAFLVQDLQTVGDSHAAVSEIISGVGTLDAPTGLLNIHNKGRFKILKRWHGFLNQTTLEGSSVYKSVYYKFRKPKNMRYNGTANSDIEANDLMFVIVTSGDPAEDSIYYNGTMRLWYTDV